MPTAAARSGKRLELRAQAVDVMGLDGAVGAREGLTRVAQAGDVAAQRRPARRSRAGARRRRARRPRSAARPRRAKAATALAVPSRAHACRPVGAALVVVEVLVEGVLEVRAVGGDALDVGLQPRPAREAVLAGDDVLGAGELERLAGRRARRRARRPAGRRRGGRAAAPWPACAAAPGSERTAGMRMTRQPPFRIARGPLAPGGKKDAMTTAGSPGWARPFRRTRRGPGRAGPTLPDRVEELVDLVDRRDARVGLGGAALGGGRRQLAEVVARDVVVAQARVERDGRELLGAGGGSSAPIASARRAISSPATSALKRSAGGRQIAFMAPCGTP